MNPRFDIKQISSGIKIFILHAGKGRKFFNIFKQNNVVFLNISDLKLTTNDFEDINSLKRKISQACFKDGDVRGLISLTGSISTLYNVAKVGDLIIIPNYGYYEKFLIGEIISDFDSSDIFISQQMNLRVPFRRVKWLPLPLNANKKNLSHDLGILLGNQKAIIEISEENQKEEILNLAYKKYIYKDISKSYISGSNYNGHNIEGIIQTLQALKRIAEIIDPDNTLEIRINFNSPGGFSIKGKKKTALLTAVIFSGALSGASLINVNQDIEQVEDLSESTTTQDIKEDICSDRMMATLDPEKYNEICQYVLDANSNINLEVE